MKKAGSILLVLASLGWHSYIVVKTPDSPSGSSSSYRSFGSGNSGGFGGFSGGHK